MCTLASLTSYDRAVVVGTLLSVNVRRLSCFSYPPPREKMKRRLSNCRPIIALAAQAQFLGVQSLAAKALEIAKKLANPGYTIRLIRTPVDRQSILLRAGSVLPCEILSKSKL